MAWWDDVQYDSLADWVPTLGKPPGDTLHDLALLRGAVCKQIYDAHELGDMLAQGRAEKLLTFLDRLVLHSPRATRRGKRKALSKTITARLRLAWAGDWGALWREAASAGKTMPQKGGRKESLKEQTRAVESFIADGLVGKAVSRVTRTVSAAVGALVYDNLAQLFPQGTLPVLGTKPGDSKHRGSGGAPHRRRQTTQKMACACFSWAKRFKVRALGRRLPGHRQLGSRCPGCRHGGAG